MSILRLQGLGGEACTQRVLQLPGVARVLAHRCQTGAEDLKGNPVKKPTLFMSNAQALCEELNNVCSGRRGACSRRKAGRHMMCNGMVAGRAAMFPLQLCESILVGFREQIGRDGVWSRSAHGMQNTAFVNIVEGLDDEEQERLYNSYIAKMASMYVDDLSGQPLDPGLVREAQWLELDFFKAKEVWIKKPLREAREVTGRAPIVATRGMICRRTSEQD